MRKIISPGNACAALALLCAACAPAKTPVASGDLHKIRHIIVMDLENHSFDNLFGSFPGADGIANAGASALQTDENGKPYAELPRVMNTEDKPVVADGRFPAHLPNKPFPIENYIPINKETPDLVHRFYQEIAQIDGGRMDRFAAISDAGGLVMGYYDGGKTGLWSYAQKYTLADHFFHGAFGGSFLNHFWMVCACAPRFEHAPKEAVITLDARGRVINDGTVTQDGYAVNTLYPAFTPHPAKAAASKTLPPQSMATIGDRLSEKGIGWAWYAGGWDDAVKGKPAPSFQFHHQPFAYFTQFADGTAARKEHLKDENDFVSALKSGDLPPVAFYKPLGEFNLHPGYADVASGDAHITALLRDIEASTVWKDTVVIVTFDENGGFWDHVAPPHVDEFGPGVRVPTLIISPFAKKSYIDHTVYDTTSILKLIEERFGLAPLGAREAAVNDLTNTLDLK